MIRMSNNISNNILKILTNIIYKYKFRRKHKNIPSHLHMLQYEVIKSLNHVDKLNTIVNVNVDSASFQLYLNTIFGST